VREDEIDGTEPIARILVKRRQKLTSGMKVYEVRNSFTLRLHQL